MMQKYNIVRLSDDEPYRYWKLYPDTIVIQYGEGLYTFLLLGKTKALLIDTAYGRGEFPNLIADLKRDLELCVVNTHGHYDHTGGNPWFPQVHMHEKAKAIARRSFRPVDPDWYANLPYPDYEMIAVEDGHIFDLGDRQVEVLYTPAHCDSSLSFIDHKRRLLFSGDEFDSGQANLGNLASVGAFLENMKRLRSMGEEYDLILPSHNGCPICKEYIDDFITAAQHVVDGKPDLVASIEDLPEYKHVFPRSNTRVQVGLACINYRNE